VFLCCCGWLGNDDEQEGTLNFPLSGIEEAPTRLVRCRGRERAFFQQTLMTCFPQFRGNQRATLTCARRSSPLSSKLLMLRMSIGRTSQGSLKPAVRPSAALCLCVPRLHLFTAFVVRTHAKLSDQLHWHASNGRVYQCMASPGQLLGGIMGISLHHHSLLCMRHTERCMH
jgi:hypothetical protein